MARSAVGLADGGRCTLTTENIKHHLLLMTSLALTLYYKKTHLPPLIIAKCFYQTRPSLHNPSRAVARTSCLGQSFDLCTTNMQLPPVQAVSILTCHSARLILRSCPS